MSPYQTIAVAVRLFAIWFAISFLPAVVGFYTKENGPDELLIAVLATVIATTLVLGLWLFPLTIARRLLPSVSIAQEPAVSADTWLAMGCALIGLWLLTTSLPSLIYGFILLHFGPDAVDESAQSEWRITYDVARLAIAGWLIFGTRGFRKLFWWARNAGVGQPSDNPSSGP